MTAEGRCDYCGAPRDRIDISTGDGVVRIAYGYCSERCVPPSCCSCGWSLTPGLRCQNLDCPVAFVIQPAADLESL